MTTKHKPELSINVYRDAKYYCIHANGLIAAVGVETDQLSDTLKTVVDMQVKKVTTMPTSAKDELLEQIGLEKDPDKRRQMIEEHGAEMIDDACPQKEALVNAFMEYLFVYDSHDAHDAPYFQGLAASETFDDKWVLNPEVVEAGLNLLRLMEPDDEQITPLTSLLWVQLYKNEGAAFQLEVIEELYADDLDKDDV